MNGPAAPATAPTPAMTVVNAPPAPTPKAVPPSVELAKAGTEGRKNAIEGIFARPGGPTPPVETPQNQPPQPPPPAPQNQPQPPPPQEEPKPIETPPKPRQELEFSEDIDFNIDEKPVATPPQNEPDPVVPPSEPNESQAVKTIREQLQIQGKLAKDLKAETQEKTIEIERLRTENARLQAELQSPKRVAADPLSHPEIQRADQALVESRNSFALTLPSDKMQAFKSGFRGMLEDYVALANDRNPEAQRQALDALQEKIGSTIGDNQVSDVIKMLEQNRAPYMSLIDKVQNFAELAEEMTLKEKVDEWSKESGKVTSAVSSIVGMDDELIEADPHTPAAYVAKLVKSDPAYAARSEQVKSVITEAFFGRRPLTKAELKGLEEGQLDGISVEDFMKAREKRVSKSREEAIRRLYVGMMMAPDLPEMIKTTVKQKQEKKAAEEEKLALIAATTTRKTPLEEKKEEHVRAVDKPSAILKVLDKF